MKEMTVRNRLWLGLCVALALVAALPGLANAQIYAAEGRRGVFGYLYVVSAATGAAVPVGRLIDENGDGYALSAMTFGPDGTLWGATTGRQPGEASQLVTINPLSGLVKPVDILEKDSDGSGDTYDCMLSLEFIGDTLYGFSCRGNNSGGTVTDQALVTINTSTGIVTEIGAPSGEHLGTGMYYDPVAEELLFYSTTNSGPPYGQLATFNTSTGALTDVRDTAYDTEQFRAESMVMVGGKLLIGFFSWDSHGVFQLVEVDRETGALTFGDRQLPGMVRALAVR